MAVPFGLSGETGKMTKRNIRTSLLLSTGRLWAMSMPFRLVGKVPGFGFAPGLRNVLRFEARRFWHWLYEGERLLLLRIRVSTWLFKR